MTPRTALADEYGPIQADDILATLKRAGLVVIDKGAIGRAQREAVRQYKEDMLAAPYPPPPPDWDSRRAA